MLIEMKICHNKNELVNSSSGGMHGWPEISVEFTKYPDLIRVITRS